MEGFLAAETVVLLGLLATMVAIAVRRIRLPYTVSLVLVGLLLSALRPIDVEVTPALILSIFVPPLIFEAAFHLDLRLLRQNLIPIIILAVPGVILSTFVVGGVVSLGAALPLTSALVFGALIAATDPVAVVALFRTLGVPRRLAVALEGESLFNDGTAIVVFQIALVAALSGTFNLTEGLFDFFWVSLGGMFVGTLLGLLAAQIIKRVDDRLVVTALTILLAYGSYLTAEHLHVSGVLAVVLAGIISGNIGMAGAQPTTKIMLYNLWDFVTFLANSLVFLLIGLEVNLPELWGNLWPIAVAVGAVLASRALVIYGLSGLVHLFTKRTHLPLKWRHVLFWGGLRGAISLALVLSLPMTMADRPMLLSMAFGVLLFTLLAQGTSIQFLLKRLGLTKRPGYQMARERRLGRLFAARAGQSRLNELYEEGVLPEMIWAGLNQNYIEHQRELETGMGLLCADHAELEREMLIQARREALRAERSALGEALQRGLLGEDVYEELRNNVDHRLEALNLIEASIEESCRLPVEED